MARANRLSEQGGIFHVTHRCHNREFLLNFARDRDACEKPPICLDLEPVLGFEPRTDGLQNRQSPITAVLDRIFERRSR